MGKLLTLREAANALGIKLITLKSYCYSGRIKCIRKDEKFYIPEEEIIRYNRERMEGLEKRRFGRSKNKEKVKVVDEEVENMGEAEEIREEKKEEVKEDVSMGSEYKDERIEFLERKIEELSRQHELFKNQVTEVIQSMPEILKTIVNEQLREVVSSSQQSQTHGQEQKTQSQPQGQQSQSQNFDEVPDAMKIEAALKQADLEFIQGLKNMGNLEKIILLSRNLQGAMAMLRMAGAGGGGGNSQQVDPSEQIREWISSIQSAFGLMTNMFKMAASTVAEAQKFAVKEDAIERAVEKALEKRMGGSRQESE